MNRVFVYGTLRRGDGNHLLLERHEARYLGNATLGPDAGFKLVTLGPFPALVPGAGTTLGELYEVSDECLGALDRLEGYRPGGTGLYDRRTMTFAHEDGEQVEAWVYVMPGGYRAPDVPGGDWIAFITDGADDADDWFYMDDDEGGEL